MGVSRRWTVEEVPSLSITALKGLLESKRLSLSFPGRWIPFIIETFGNHITIDLEGGNDPQVVHIEYTTVGYGKRPWFCCPFCTKRCGKLYRLSGVYGCRGCHDLTYTTCQLSGNDLEYLSLKIRRLQEKLHVSKENSWPCFGLTDASIEWLPIFKPKYMKQSTFDRLRSELEIMQIHRVKAWLAMVR